MARKTPKAPATAQFPIAGIGASAGGLRALQTLFRHTAADGGIAWVVVTHLAPDQESHLAELLQSSTAMPVQQVRGDVELQPNQVYVIPPNRNLSAIDTHLRLDPLERERAGRAPIDHFFRTLADIHGNQAIGVVLSGTGSDGAQGLARIKEMGGLPVVQDPEEAEYDSMPRSAIALGQVDLVLPVAEIPSRIAAYVERSPALPLPKEAGALPESLRVALQQLLALVRVHTGLDFSRYKRGTLVRRIQHRMQLYGLQEMEAYVGRLRADPGEVRALANDLLISVTNFFRDRAAFALIEREVIPQLFEGKTAGEPVRVWVAGCATGEEAYSLAILLLEYAYRTKEGHSVQVFATDLSEAALQRAREGFYPETIAEDISPERLARFFTQEKGGYRVRKEVREIVLFAPHNLLKDPPFSKVDLISCRNVLIYLEREVHPQLLDIFHYALRPQGWLLLGTAEVVDGSSGFRTVNRKQSLYRRQEIPGQERTLPALPLIPAFPQGAPLAPAVPGPSAPAQRYGLPHGRLLERFAPPSLLVAADYNIVYYSTGTHAYLQQPAGEPTHNVLKRVRDELQPELVTALFRAFTRHEPALSPPIAMQLHGEARQVLLGVWPAAEETQEMALVLFHERPVQQAGGAEPGMPVDQVLVGLEEERETLRRQLQATVEEYETSKEEMQAANEELQSMNEELRATAEELETSKEELQSINEELMTVNQENKHRVETLSQLSSDLQNLLAATDIATLFLDRELRITRFTPRASDLFNVLPTDRGRPLAHLTHKLNYAELIQDAEQVLRTLIPIERELQDKDARWYLTRLLPYRSVEDRIEGIVITFVDISERKRAEDALQASEQRLAEELAIMRRLHESITRLLVCQDLDTALSEVLDATLEITGAAMGIIQLFDPVDQRLHVVAQHGFEQSSLDHLRSADSATGSTYHRAMQQRQRVIVEDVETDPDYAPHRAAAAAAGYRAIQSTPLLSRAGELLGVLSTYYSEPRRPSERDLRSLDLYARQAADFIERIRGEETLRQAQASLALALEAAQMGTFDLDIASDSTRRNLRRDQIFGHREPPPTWGRAASRKQVLPEDLEIFDAALARAFETGIYDLEARIRWPDGSIHWFHDLGRVDYDERGRPVRIVGVTLDTTERKAAEAAELRRRIIQSQEAERARWAREIHDGPVQDLVALTLELALLAEQQEERLQVPLAVLRARIERAIRHLRDLMVTLRPPALLQFGLAAALTEHVAEVRLKQPALTIALEVDEPLPALAEEESFALFRIAQQSLYNVIRHARAQHVWLRLRRETDPSEGSRLMLEVEDDGQGFVVPAQWIELARQGHLGLVSMVERAEGIGGQLQVFSTPGQGTRVRAVLPLPAAEKDGEKAAQ